ncbi:MAG: MBL fold metallo-hydrolase [Acidimicrobiales bacterium]
MKDLVVEAVTDRVWCLRRCSYLTCSYLVRGDHGVVLVDAGMDSAAGDVELGLRHAGATWEDLSAIVLTHWHNDHAAGARESQHRSGAATYCGRAEVPFLTGATRRPGLLGALGDRWPERGPLVLAKGLLTNAPRHSVDEPIAVADGDVVAGLQIIATPGHTPGHISVWDPNDRILFSGDALAIVGGSIRHMARPVTPDRLEAKRSMLRLLDLGPTLICPGHRRPMAPSADELRTARAAASAKRWPLFG